MRRLILALMLIFPFFISQAQMDLPNPPANFENIPAGSFVIPMDTINQAIVPAGDAPFNLKAYGLINKFLQNGIPVKWAIRAGKSRDAIDFSALASRVFPSAIPASNVDFIGGPFILPDTTLPCGLTTPQIIQNFGNNVAVFQLQQSVSVDIRYTLQHRPKIAVFNNGGNQLIHQKILDAAGIPDYVVLSAAQIATLGDCFTFASEPHADSMQVTPAMVAGIQQFVLNGGNFLSQCLAVESYESRGFFQTTTGMNITNQQVINNYVNSDMAAAQIHGPLFENRFGSCANWTFSPGSVWRAYYYPMVTDQSPDTVIFTAAHIIAPNAIGGNVFFLGGHDYGRVPNGGNGGFGPGGPVADLTDLVRVNGLRYYLNAVMIPTYNTNAAWANAGPDLTLNCGDSSALGCSQTGPLNATYSWSPASGLSCTNCPNPIVHPGATTTYVVTVGMSCNATDTVTVNVTAATVVTVNDGTLCSGDTVSLNANGGISYTWTPSTGLSGITGSSVIANPNTTTVYTVTGTDANGCSGSALATVTVNPLPSVSAGSTSVCDGDSANLIANGALNYSWLPALGLISTVANTALVQPAQTTTYTVVGTDANGCIDSADATVSVNNRPILIANDETICTGDTATLSVSGNQNGIAYLWTTNSTDSSTAVSPNISTSYSVTGTSSLGCTSSISVQVNVNQLPVIVANNATICIGQSAALNAQGGQTYSWISNTGQTFSGSSITVSPAVTTSYTVTGTDFNSCINTASSSVLVNPLPVISSTSDTICRGENGSLQASGGLTYSWNPGNISGSVISVTPQNTTAYTVTSSDANGCSSTASGIIYVNENPTVTSTSDIICQGDYGTLTASGAVVYSWMPSGNPGSSFSDNPSVTTNYSVTGTSAAGCTNTASATITVNLKPQVSIDAGPSGCAPVTATFQNLTQNAMSNNTCQWTFGDGTSSTDFNPPPHVYSNPGSYSVNLTVNNNGCTSSTSSPKIVSVYSNPTAGFTLDHFETGAMESQVQLFNSSVDDLMRYWYFGDGTDDFSGINNPVHLYRDTGTYTICLSIENAHGCADSICKEITVKPTWSFFIPNAFTPNADTKNDGFIGKSTNLIEHEMWIYDRWGLLIYDTGKTRDPESAKAWNGITDDGSTPVQNDVYVWRVILRDINEDYHSLVGHVTVVK